MWTTRFSRYLIKKCIVPVTSEVLGSVNNCRIKNDFCTRCTTSFCRLHTKNSTNALESVETEREIAPVNKFVQRSHTCGELTLENVGEDVQLCGWMEFHRMGKFVILRDSYGSTQLIIPNAKSDLIRIVKHLYFESVLSITGTVLARPPGQENPEMRTGAIEVKIKSLQVHNECLPQLPFSIRKFNVPKENLQMQYRYLALRFPFLQRNLRVRSQLLNKMRFFLIDDCGFVDVETPTLFRRTPGGAQEFVVPTQHPGKFYSLVQSPQQFKQLLMVGGIDRYFQIARCYRDETARPDRQPEFTQLDIEMSFTDREGIMTMVEQLIANCWPKDFGDVTVPFKRFTYEEIMDMYGSDQPDLRIPYRIHNITNLLTRKLSDNVENFGVYALLIPKGSNFLTNSVKTQMMELIKEFKYTKVVFNQMKASGYWQEKLESKCNIDASKFQLEFNIHENDAVFIAQGHKDNARKLLGKVLKEFSNIMEAKGLPVRSKSFNFLWIVDFPLFEKTDNDTLASTHHPFTAPHPEDVQYLESDPLKVRGLHYDLVLNGSEIAGGSIRIHDAELQEKVLNWLNIDTSQMTHLLEALKSGAPPHGGIAFGLDRLLSIMCDSPSIREVIAFPKTGDGKDLMSGAPAEISDEEKTLYHLKMTAGKTS